MKLLLIILCSISLQLCAQDVFWVYQLKGNVTQSGKQLMIGDKLEEKSVINVSKNSQIILLCNDNNTPISITKDGSYTLSMFSDSCKNIEGKVPKNYFRYLKEQLTSKEELPEDNRRNFMENTGAVVRGCPGKKINRIFDTINYYQGNFYIKWDTSLASARTAFALFDQATEGQLLYKYSGRDKFISIDSVLKYGDGKSYLYWGLLIDGREYCSRKVINISDKGFFLNLLATIKNSCPQGVSEAEQDYFTGFFLEFHNFVYEAYGFYKKAFLADPSNSLYNVTVKSIEKQIIL